MRTICIDVVCNRIAEAHSKLGWSNYEIARRSRVSPATISRIEARESLPLNSVAAAICSAVEAGLSERLAAFAKQLEPSRVPLLPAPRDLAARGWYDASTVPVGVWVWAKADKSHVAKMVSYEPDKSLYPWVTHNRKRRIRWDIFDCWRSDPVRS